MVASGQTLAEQNEALLEELSLVHRLTPDQTRRVREIFAESGFVGQGNPQITRHPMTVEQCRERQPLARSGSDPELERRCGAPFMVPLFDPNSESATDARVCIDQFEFPDVPCAFPVVWVRAREAAELCTAVGKRLCDAHEWEGACAGALTAPDYRFDLSVNRDEAAAVKAMREAHNRTHAADKSWSYGGQYQPGVCAAASSKSEGCDGGNWRQCGSNTYPAGAFPACRSSLGVYDLNGNAAEHMNLPLAPEQLASRGDQLGVTEMKGSWFIFDQYRAHEDWCRWRAPFWHGSRVMDPKSHHNYHLGFRCCKTVAPQRENP
ncbi:MAG: formylglycine-generating enzyme family protein [Thermoanaerobaculia bacterium]|nr:formylglycine-generating enzyme family protein [Thermoanaerobaculia bacterium]